MSFFIFLRVFPRKFRKFFISHVNLILDFSTNIPKYWTKFHGNFDSPRQIWHCTPSQTPFLEQKTLILPRCSRDRKFRTSSILLFLPLKKISRLNLDRKEVSGPSRQSCRIRRFDLRYHEYDVVFLSGDRKIVAWIFWEIFVYFSSKSHQFRSKNSTKNYVLIYDKIWMNIAEISWKFYRREFWSRKVIDHYYLIEQSRQFWAVIFLL